MQAGFSDPQGPRIWRMVPYLAPVLMLLTAIFAPPGWVSEVTATMLGIASVAIFNMIGLVGLRQRVPRTAEIECGPGYIEVKKSGSRNQRIAAKDITGAT